MGMGNLVKRCNVECNHEAQLEQQSFKGFLFSDSLSSTDGQNRWVLCVCTIKTNNTKSTTISTIANDFGVKPLSNVRDYWECY